MDVAVLQPSSLSLSHILGQGRVAFQPMRTTSTFLISMCNMKNFLRSCHICDQQERLRLRLKIRSRPYVITMFNTIVCMSSATGQVSSYNLQQHFPDSSSCTRLNLAGLSRNAAQLPAAGYGSSSTSITSRKTVMKSSMLNVVVA